MKILVVDSDQPRREQMSADLRRQWTVATVLGVGTGEAAVRLLSAQRFDLVLLTACPSDTTEFDILREIRRLSDATILVLLVDNDEATHIQSLDLGADDCIAPPASRA